MKLFSITKTQFKLIYLMYNLNLDVKHLTNFTEINQAYKLNDMNPDLFSLERIDHRNYVFKIKNLGSVLDLINYNLKYEKEL